MATAVPLPSSPCPFEAIHPSLNNSPHSRSTPPRSTRKQTTTPRRTPFSSPSKRSGSSQGSMNEMDENHHRLNSPSNSFSITPLKPISTTLRSAMKQLRINTPTSSSQMDSPTLLSRTTTNTFNSRPPQTSPLRSPTKSLRFEISNGSPLGRREAEEREDERDVERDSLSDSGQESDWQTDAEDPSTPIRKPLSSLPPCLLPQTPSAYRFSPSTPSVRTHKSYEEDELTDCDADGSIWEEAESSLSYPSAGRGGEIEAVLEENGDTVIGDEEWVEEEQDEREEVVEETETSEIGIEVGRIEEEESSERISDLETGQELDGHTKEELWSVVEGIVEEETIQFELDAKESGQTTDEIEETIAEVEGETIQALAETSEEDERPKTPQRTPSPTLEHPPSPLLTLSQTPICSSLALSPPGPLAEPLRAVPSTLEQTAPVPASLPVPLPASTTPKKATAFAPVARMAQPQVHDAPTARRQLTKLSSLATKRSFDSLNDPKRRTVLTAMVPGSAASTSRKMVSTTTKASLGTPSHAPGIPRPTPSSSSISRLTAPSSIRSRTVSDSATSRLATVNENNPPTKSKLSSSLPSSTSSMRPPTSTIPRPRPLVKSGLKPPASLSSSRTVPTPSTRGVQSSRPALSSMKPTRPVVPSTSRPVFPSALSRLHRPEPLPSSSEIAKPLSSSLSGSTAPPPPRQLPALQQTSSAPALLPSRGPTPPLQQATQLPPVPRSARPVKIDRTVVIPATSTNTLHAISSRSPQKKKAETIENTSTKPVASNALSQPPLSVETPIKPPHIASSVPSQPLPTSPDLPLTTSSPSRTTSTFTARSSPVSRRPPATSSSPLRSPRRVPIDQPPPPAFPASTTSALVLPAEKLIAVSSSLDVFGSNSTSLPPAPLPTIPVAQLPVRSARPRRAKTVDDESTSSTPAIPVPTKRITRRTAAVSTIPTAPLPPSQPVAPLIPRSSRRPPKPVAPIVIEESEPSSLSSSSSSSQASTDESTPPAPSFLFNPAPSVTQEELNRLTQRNTKKNQQSFNKLKIETIFIESNRPPSPTSKIRKSLGASEGGVGKPTTKEGREARAAKRRNALRSSTDGSEFEALRGEIGDGELVGEGKEAVVHHYRAPGDEEQFCSPMRPVKKSGGKKKSSTTTVATKKVLRWDKALVYEGPKDDALEETAASGIIKALPLDQWGNSTETSTNFAKPSPVVIRKRVFKDDEQ